MTSHPCPHRCREDLRQHRGPWPARVCVGMGTAEYGSERFDALLVSYAEQLGALLRSRGLGDDRLLVQVCGHAMRPVGGRHGRHSCCPSASRTHARPPPALQIGEGDAHTEAAWARRLPAALAFLGQAWLTQ